MKKILTIEGMSCKHCAFHVSSALEAVPGVTKVEVDLLKKSALVEGDNVSDQALRAAVTEAGYRVSALVS